MLVIVDSKEDLTFYNRSSKFQNPHLIDIAPGIRAFSKWMQRSKYVRLRFTGDFAK